MIFQIYNFLIYLPLKLFNPIKGKEFENLEKAHIWVHCCSLGEVMAAQSLVDEFLKSNKKVFLTTFTSAGFRKAKELWAAGIQIRRFPYDEKKKIKLILEKVAPEIFIDIETELWPNMLLEVRKKGIPAFLVNARISEKNYRRIKYFKKIFRMLLKSFCRIYAQSSRDAKRILSFGIEPDRVRVTGNLKYDSIVESEKIKREEFQIPESAFVITFGSIRSREENKIIDVIFQLLHNLPDIYIILAPRHLSRVEVIKSKLKRKSLEYTTRKEGKPEKGKIFILDTLGELRKFYSISEVAFVGGTLEDYGGHNLMEPASFGIPVIFGPFVSNVESVALNLLREKGGILVRNTEELVRTICDLYNNTELRIQMGQNALHTIKSRQGIAREIVNDIESLLRSRKCS